MNSIIKFSVEELSTLESVKILGGSADSINAAQIGCKNQIFGCGYECNQFSCLHQSIACGEKVELACTNSELDCGKDKDDPRNPKDDYIH